MNRSSPMMEQYIKIKGQHPDKLLMFQVGDFFELFFEDARVAAREIDIALTSRGTGSDDPIPLAGVPIHAAETYLNRLLAKGFKVVLCEQVEDARKAKGLVRREVTRILTPGTVTDPQMLEESRNNYLVTLLGEGGSHYALSALDLSTGDFLITEQKGERAGEIIADELNRLQPSEMLCGSSEVENFYREVTGGNNSTPVELLASVPDLEDAKILIHRHWKSETWENLQLDHYFLAAKAAASALVYLEMLQQLPGKEKYFSDLKLYFSGNSMIIDSVTARNLELTRSLREGSKEGSLLGLLDCCVTAMGRRLLRRRLELPLLSRERIEKRLDAVEEFVRRPLQRNELRRLLRDVFDLERFCSRLTYRRVNARDLVSLKKTLLQVKSLKEKVAAFKSVLGKEISAGLPDFGELYALIDKALLEDPPPSLKEGGLFKRGYNDEVDRLKNISQESSTLLLDFEQKERERTGIKSLRIGYNRNFGYYMEVTKTNLGLVPPEYHRKQTLVNAERFSTEKLQQIEEQVTGAREKLVALEYSLFEKLREEVTLHTNRLLTASHNLARLDFVQGLAEVAEKQHYCRPFFSNGGIMTVEQARHPVVEQTAIEPFVPNDIKMNKKHFMLVITGPNMAGKSTYIRSAALVAIMAQVGSFVPASRARLPLLDRVFARVGASDDLSRGQSTFMMEMQETAAILREATPSSLVILDEIGRGTSTYDGMSIARSVLEYISRRIKARTLFSTHYHELTTLEGELPGVKNYTISVKEKGREVIFLRQVIPGKADKSYGINVARLAGVPVEVLYRAEKILGELEMTALNAGDHQLSLLPMVSEPSTESGCDPEVIKKIKEIDLNRTTPLEAIQVLYELQKLALDQDKEGKE